jgi:hypothetical protein
MEIDEEKEIEFEITSKSVKYLNNERIEFVLKVDSEDDVIYYPFVLEFSKPNFPETTKYLVYPNPTTGELTVCGERYAVCGIEVFDVYGRNVSYNHHIITSSHHLINISALSAGVYFLKIDTEKGTITKKIIKD